MHNSKPSLQNYLIIWKNWVETDRVSLKHALHDFIPSYFPWRYHLTKNYGTPLQEHIPWMTFSTIRFLEKTLTKQAKIFEYGSGGSTLFFAKRVREIISIEHDNLWLEKVQNELNKSKLKNWQLILKQPQNSDVSGYDDPSNPLLYSSGAEQYKDKCFKSYATSIEQFPDRYFDVILIDGRARPSCFVHSIKKIKPGGYIIWDNTNRQHYQPVITNAPNDWKLLDFSGPTPYSFFFTHTFGWRCIL